MERRSNTMATPFVLITTHRIKPGQYERFVELSRDFAEFVRANVPEMLGYYAYLDADRSEVSLVQIHRDATSAEHHMTVSAEKIGQGIALVETVRVEVYGHPGPVVSQAGAANATAGAQVSIKPEVLGGFTRG
jgi:quinol monooxygenase YgiN